MSSSRPAKKSKLAQSQLASEDQDEVEEWETDSDESTHANPHDDEEFRNRLPYEYYCISRPQFDLENENEEKDENEQLDDEDMEELAEKLKDADLVHKPAADYPDHQWIALAKTWSLYYEWVRRAAYADPDNFGMYIHNDLYGYGLQELIENMLVKLNQELSKKDKDETTVKKLWAPCAALVHWMLYEEPDMGVWYGLEDGPRVEKTCKLISCMFLETLNKLDMAGQLKPDSQIKDLALVICLYLQWGKPLEEYALEEEVEIEWQKELIAYSKKAGLNLETCGCSGVPKMLEFYKERYGEIAPLEGTAKANRWNWKKAFKDFSTEYALNGKLGGEQNNIMKFSRQKRARYAFDKKDPLAHFSQEELNSGTLMLG